MTGRTGREQWLSLGSGWAQARPGFRTALLTLLVLPVLLALSALGQSPTPSAPATDPVASPYLGRRLEVLPAREVSPFAAPEAVYSAPGWTPAGADVPNLGNSDEAYWIRLRLQPETEAAQFLEVQNATLDRLDAYLLCDGEVVSTRLGLRRSEGIGAFPGFAIPAQPCNETAVLMLVASGKPIVLPVRIAEQRQVLSDAHRRDVVFGAYAGILLVMLLYNLFLFFSVGDRSYLHYTLYILTVGGAQLSLNGYGQWFGLSHLPWLELRQVHFFGVFSGLATIVFARRFLQLKTYAPWLSTVLHVYTGIYLLALLLAVAGVFVWSYHLITFCAAAIFLLIPGAIQAIRKGYRPAIYFLVAWLFFIVSVVVFVLKDAGVIPFNLWTSFAMPLGNSVEVVLLSLALASKINELKREGAEAREAQLQLAQRNEQMVKDQNQLLEAKVEERTEQLQAANRDLNATLQDLRAAQEQLVQSEKLASIGQLTAGIAHELNNPINFVSSSSQSLRRDFEDVNEVLRAVEAIAGTPEEMADQMAALRARMVELDLSFTQQEIEELLTGIEDGAQRTAEIVRGLRIFSRMDGDAFIEADLNELMTSTLVILRSNLRDRVQLDVELAPQLPTIRCQPGRLNQVFMNVINNAAQATQLTDRPASERRVRIRSWSERLPDGNAVLIGISDNGPGIPDEIKSQIFDPFFTTKPVGEGTGLGLSIVMGILKDHQAEVEVRTQPGEGTEFILRFPA